MFCYKKPPNVIFFPLALENILEFGKIWDIFSKLSFFQQLQGGFFNWPPPPHARLNRALVHGLAVHEEVGAS